MANELALVVSGASGMLLAARFAELTVTSTAVEALHVVVTDPAATVLGHELGPEWGSVEAFCASLAIDATARARLRPWSDGDLMAPIASGSRPLAGVVVLPCSAGMAGALAGGVSRGLAQRVADVALKQGWPLVLGVRETPMATILLDNLLRLSRAGARIVPPLPAFYLRPDPEHAVAAFVDHYCLRVLDLFGLSLDRDDLRWQG